MSAGRYPAHPIPVVFPLSSWVVSRKRLDHWLGEELERRYKVEREVAQEWIANNTVLPLLDGLDEVAISVRDNCVEAINAFRATRGHLPLVVCSRISDYDELTVKLRFHETIVIQPLSRDQVRQYVREIVFPVTPRITSPLWNLLTTPLMLNIATLASVGRPGGIPLTLGDVADSQDHLIAAYIERRLSQDLAASRYSAAQMQHYLSWLAWHMQQHNRTAFYMEYVQSDWLPLRYGWLPPTGVGLLSGLVSGFLSGW